MFLGIRRAKLEARFNELRDHVDGRLMEMSKGIDNLNRLI